jgi:TRAP transporter 4TM/12TM fusion protein
VLTEAPGRRLAVAVVAVEAAIAVGVLAQAWRPLPQGSQYYLILFLAATLPLVFLRFGTHPVLDRALAAAALVAGLYPVLPWPGGGYDAFLDRSASDPLDLVLGVLLLGLILEACRRTSGWVLPVVCLAFLAYAYYGGALPQSWPVAHPGLDVDQIVDALYTSGSGFFGTPLDVAATAIVLFTIYGAVLERSGAGQFFVDLSVATFRRSRSAAGRTAVAGGFLLGTVSGSGTATTVSIGSVTWPVLRRAGYPPERAGGMLAAAGVGAILSPPTMGAAAFIVAGYLDVSYLTVLGWALLPTLLYYFGILLAVECDARRFGVVPAAGEAPASPWRLLARYGYHFASLFVVVALLMADQTVTRAVLTATAVAVLLSFADRSNALTPRRLYEAAALGIRGVLIVVAVCAAAGVVTAVTTTTGLGAQTGSLLVRTGRGVSDDPAVVLAVTAVLAAVALTLLGLAVPVTASFIIGWVVVAPALLDLGVGEPATAMFVFYYSVLSEVTPPTALAAVGAAAITGARPIATMWQALRYALPAFLLPMAFVLTHPGSYLLDLGAGARTAAACAAAAAGIAALAIACGGWVLGVGAAGVPERVAAAAAGAALLYVRPGSVIAGAVLLAAAVAGAAVRRRRGSA